MGVMLNVSIDNLEQIKRLIQHLPADELQEVRAAVEAVAHLALKELEKRGER